MIPDRIVRYLQRQRIPFARRWHPRAVTAQELAHSMHVSGYRIGKTVVLDVDGETYLAVVPAPARIDAARVAEELGADSAVLRDEEEFADLFPDCELGSEPPFGQLYGLKVLVDESLAGDEPLLLRAGSHEEVIELTGDDFLAIEKPTVARIATWPRMPPMSAEAEMRM